MREAQEEQVIKKVSDADFLEHAFKNGRAIMALVERMPSGADSIGHAHQVDVVWLEPGSAHASDIEKQLIDAYLNSMMLGEELTDNVQRLGADSLLYTKPIINELPDGVVEVKGTWNIRMSKKQLVLAMGKK